MLIVDKPIFVNMKLTVTDTIFKESDRTVCGTMKYRLKENAER